METTRNTPEQNLPKAELVVLQAECDPSLKDGLRAKFREAGFSSFSDGIRTLARDFNAGRIKYKDGVLESQQKIAG